MLLVQNETEQHVGGQRRPKPGCDRPPRLPRSHATRTLCGCPSAGRHAAAVTPMRGRRSQGRAVGPASRVAVAGCWTPDKLHLYAPESRGCRTQKLVSAPEPCILCPRDCLSALLRDGAVRPRNETGEEVRLSRPAPEDHHHHARRGQVVLVHQTICSLGRVRYPFPNPPYATARTTSGVRDTGL
jgi:hypothetical protein